MQPITLFTLFLFSLCTYIHAQSDPAELSQPLFEYQIFGMDKIKMREFHKTIYFYDSLGNVTRSMHYLEKDSNFLASITRGDINDVTSFPYFTMEDSLTIQFEKEGYLYVSIEPADSSVNYYLKDLVLRIKKNRKQVDLIVGKLIIHVSSLDKGDYTYDEIYVAKFGKVKKYYLPTEITYFPIDDKTFQRPRMVEKITYILK